MNKYVLLVLLIVFDVLGAVKVSSTTHNHGSILDHHSIALEAADHGQSSETENCEDHCPASQCCRHAHTMMLTTADINFAQLTTSFLINFQYDHLPVSENIFEIIKPPII